jgi:hypothetical protein
MRKRVVQVRELPARTRQRRRPEPERVFLPEKVFWRRRGLQWEAKKVELNDFEQGCQTCFRTMIGRIKKKKTKKLSFYVIIILNIKG